MASASHILTFVSSVALRLSVYIFLRWVSAQGARAARLSLKLHSQYIAIRLTNVLMTVDTYYCE